MRKFIASMKMNSLLVNIKADRALAEFNKKNPGCVDLASCTEKPILVQVVLRVPMFKKKEQIPFYAFIKHSNTVVALVDVETGGTQVLDPSVIASETEVQNTFRINGVTYGPKKEINGFKCYRPLSYEPKRPRQNLTPLSKEVVEAEQEMVDYGETPLMDWE